MKQIFISLSIALLFASCESLNHFAASNYTTEWKDFHQPKDVKEDFSIAITPELTYLSGGDPTNSVRRSLYGGYVGVSSIVKEHLLINLGGGYELGRATIHVDNDPNTIDFYKTNAYQLNTQFGWRVTDFENDFYPLIVGLNYGADNGDYLDFRQRLSAQPSDQQFFRNELIDTEDLLSVQVGMKTNHKIDEDFLGSLYAGILLKDESTSLLFSRGGLCLLGQMDIRYQKYVLSTQATTGIYGGVGLSVGRVFD